jgi:hypothetical protein
MERVALRCHGMHIPPYAQVQPQQYLQQHQYRLNQQQVTIEHEWLELIRHQMSVNEATLSYQFGGS